MSEDGEDEMSEGSDDGEDDGDEYDDEDDDEPSADDDSDAEKKKKKKKKGPSEIKDVPPDPYLIRREATLLHLCLKSFKKRVIIFFNEKIQCHRMLILFKMFEVKATEVQGNLT
jgi:hypothetical protein